MGAMLSRGRDFAQGFFVTHAPQSMARALAAWFALAAVAYGWVTRDAVITGIFCAQSAACLGLRSKPPREKPDAPSAAAQAVEAANVG